MILLDTNLLVYASNERMAEHTEAKRWLESVLGEGGRVGMPWSSTLGFLRIATNRRIFSAALLISDAWTQVRNWLAAPGVWIPEPTDRHAAILGELLRIPGLGAADVPDAHLAALAIEHGLILCSTDSGFARFDDLRWRNPLREPPRVRERRRRYGRR